MNTNDGIILTNISLTSEESNQLKIEAAKAGKSKRDLATQVTRDWLVGQSLKDRFVDIAKDIAMLPDKERYFEALDRLIEGSTKLVGSAAQEAAAQVFHRSFSDQVFNNAKKDIEESLETLREVTTIPELNPVEFGFLVVKAYFANRS